MTTTYLNKTFSTPTNSKKYTMAGWFKRSGLSSNQYFYSYDSGGNAQFVIGFYSSDKFTVYDRDASSGSDDINYVTTAVFRDTAAWYHLVVAVDTTDSTSGDRVKIYVNGTRLTAFDTSTAPAQDYDTIANSAISKDIGRWQAGSNYYYGYMSQFIFLDGYALTPSSFGSTNANGVWIPNTSPSVTYGNNGFKLDFADSGASAATGNFGSDSSGNNNHFTSNNLGTNPSTTDTPQNIFATFNAVDKRAGGVDFSDGNTKVVTSGSNRNYVTLTQAFTSGKWYMECRYTAGASAAGVGFCDMSDLQMSGTSTLGDKSNEARVTSGGEYEKNNSVTSGWAGSFTDNDILGLALDCDNNRFTISKNGQFADGSGNYDEANPTAYITYTAGNFMTFAFGEGAGGATATIEINTGNSPYAIASGNADANGYGNFEYAVPSGYYALCTKNLGQYGG
tara:strand:- start:997 stop:2346 length:1350 start_codon:yes stop_codon:yes gene_type:complete